MSVNSTETVSVIICCYTEERLQDIREAVASVQAQTRPPEEVILAVDNNQALCERLGAEFAGQVKLVLNDSVKGLSATRNTGIAATSSNLVAFLDDDAVADPQWIANLVALFDDPKVVVAGGQAIPKWVETRPKWFPADLDWVVGGSYIGLPLNQRAEVQNPHGCNMCFRKEVFSIVGLFDCAVGRIGKGGQAGEEADFCLRLKRKWPEAKVIYEPTSVIHHKVPSWRGKWGYLISRSYQEGVCKARINHINQSSGVRALSRESAYLRLLLMNAIPSRLMRFWSFKELAQAAAIFTCIASTGTGYLRGKWRSKNLVPPPGLSV